MNGKPLYKMTPDEIKKAVKEKYGQVAANPEVDFNFPVGKQFALQVGYPASILEELPQSMYESFTGANNPQPFVGVREGETILDLGCGAGLDIFFLAKATGSAGKVYGLDIAEEMVEKAITNMKKLGIENAELVPGDADNLPFDDNFFDLVASNGIYNLSPDKEKVMCEVFRVLGPGGRTVFCDIVLKEPLPEDARESIDDWFKCIGGALPEDEFLSLMYKVGFTKVDIMSRVKNARTGHQLSICANVRAEKE